MDPTKPPKKRKRAKLTPVDNFNWRELDEEELEYAEDEEDADRGRHPRASRRPEESS